MTALRFKHDSEKGVMHFVEYQGKTVGLSLRKAQKIGFIKEFGFLNIAFDLKSKDFEQVQVTVVTDVDYIKEVYEDMLQKDNTYFKEGYAELCVLVFHK